MYFVLFITGGKERFQREVTANQWNLSSSSGGHGHGCFHGGESQKVTHIHTHAYRYKHTHTYTHMYTHMHTLKLTWYHKIFHLHKTSTTY